MKNAVIPIRTAIAPRTSPSSSFSESSRPIMLALSRPPVQKANRSPAPDPTVSDAGSAPAESRVSGRRFVLAAYAAFVAFGGLLGFGLGFLFGSDLGATGVLGIVPATPLGLAVYGAITMAVVLGAPLALVAYVSRR